MVTKSKEIDLRREAEQRIPMSYEEWLADLPEDIHTEWVNGEAIIFISPNTRHQDIADFLLILVRLFVEFRNLGRVISAPYEMRLAEQKSAREPDILFIAAEHKERITAERLWPLSGNSPGRCRYLPLADITGLLAGYELAVG